MYLEMLAGIGVGDLHHLLAGVAEHDLAVIAPGGAAASRGRRQGIDELWHQFRDRRCDAP